MIFSVHDLLTIEQVAEVLNVSDQTVRKLVKNNEIKTVKFGRTYRITKQALNEFIIEKQGWKVLLVFVIVNFFNYIL